MGRPGTPRPIIAATHPQVKIPAAVANYLVLTTVDADPALSAEQSRPKGRVVLPIFIRQGWPQAMSHLSVTHGPGGPPRRMKMGNMSGPLGRPLLRGGGERRVDRISHLRACRGDRAFSTQGSTAGRCAIRRSPRSCGT